MREGEDVVDCTSPDDEMAAQARKRRRSNDVIDLASDEDGAEAEAAARRRIMEHARRVNLERGLGGGPNNGTAPPAHIHNQQQQQNADGLGDTAPLPTAQTATAPDAALPGPNRLLAELHAERMARMAQRRQQQGHGLPGSAAAASHLGQPGSRQQQQQQAPPAALHPQHPQQGAQGAGGEPRVSVLTWNVWFREDIHVEARMAAIGAVVQERQPTFVCFQEVTPLIYQLFASSTWWPAYHASPLPPGVPYFTLLLWSRAAVQAGSGFAEIPYENSCMGRDLKTVAGRVAGRSIRVATTHLESPTGWGPGQSHREARQAQLRQAAAVLDRAREEDVVLVGDMNWGPDDGVPPLPGGWCDAFIHLHGAAGEEEGLTYDGRRNPMLKKTNRLRRRLDRAFCKLRRWRLAGLAMVGRDALPGLQFEGRPVLPSDHFGLLLDLQAAG